MNNNNETAIPLDMSKRMFFKPHHMFAVMFVVVLLIAGRDTYQNIDDGNWIAAALPFVTITVIFALAMVMETIKAKRGLVFNSLGVIDNSLRRPVFIPWSEIVGSDLVKRNEKDFFVLKVRNPQKYNPTATELHSLIQSQHLNHFNSPFAFNCAGLKIALPELQSLFETYHRQYGSR